MATYDLTNQPISSSFDTLLQIDSGSALRDGTGSLVDNIITTASYAVTAAFAENVIDPTWDNIQDKPSGLVSGSSQIDLAQTFGTASHAISASYAVSASYEIRKEVSSSYADHVPFDGILNKPTLVSGSSQITLEDTTFTDNGADSFLSTDGAGNLSFQYVESLYQNIRNMESVTIYKGTPLFVDGQTGDNANVYIADAGNPSRFPATLIAGDTSLGPSAVGKGLISGKINNVDTNLYPAGTEVYLGVGGGWTATRPTGSAQVQILGVVSRQGNNGEGIFINQLQAHLPNLTQGYAWVGNSDGVPEAVATSSFAVSIDTGSLVTTSSFNQYTASNDSKVNELISKTGSYATTGSNLFTDTQTISGSNPSNNELRIGSSVKITDQPDFVNKFSPSTLEGVQEIIGNVGVSGSDYWRNTAGNRTSIGVNGSAQDLRVGFGTPYQSADYTYSFKSSSAEFKTSLSTNTISNPQTITDNVIIPTGENGVIIGETTITGTYTVEGDSEVFVFTQPPTGGYVLNTQYQTDSASFDSRINNISVDTSSLATTGSNTFYGNQTISGSTFISGGLEVNYPDDTAVKFKGDVEVGDLDSQQQGRLGVWGQIILRSGSGIITDGAFGDSVPFDSPVSFFNGINFPTPSGIEQPAYIDFRDNDPLPSGTAGRLAVSGSNLYFHNGTSWSQIN